MLSTMKNLLERFSVTKLVLLIITLTLVFIEIYKTVTTGDTDELWNNVVIAVISFYFWQKAIQYEKPDSLVDSDDAK